MALLGKLVKTGLEINQKLSQHGHNFSDAQLQQLKSLLKEARNTAFGKYYGFKQILAADDIGKVFREAVPIFEYHTMEEQWWNKQQILPDITWPGKPGFFALSSGTTGKSSKRIPITDSFLQSIRDVGTSMLSSLSNYDLPEELFEKEFLMISSTSHLQSNEKGFSEGEISGINVNNFPNWYDLFYRPGKEIASIPDWDQRLKRIIEEAPDWDIGAIAGIPSWVLLVLQEIVKHHGLEHIHEMWPSFSAYASGGVAFETYRKDFEALCGKDIIVVDTYLASEGFLAYTMRPDTMAMRLALHHGYYFEFIPFDETGVTQTGEIKQNPKVLGIGEVEEDKGYVLIVSTCSGAWRYQIGDVIKFTSLKNAEIIITGRTKFFLNVVGSQLSEDKMDDAIVHLSKVLNVDINEYSVSALQDKDGNYYHQWVLVSNADFDTEVAKQTLDERLKILNKNYKVARSKALKYLKLSSIPKSKYHDYLKARKKKGGQVKTPKVMPAEKMQDYLSFSGL